MSQTLHFIEPNDMSLAFPPLEQALTEPNGLLAIGGNLSCKRLISAYSQGIFPWFSEGDPIMWWSPSPRAIIPVDDIRINRTLKKTLNRKTFNVTLNQAFDQVIDACADAPFRTEETWIVDEMLAAYKALHQQGSAHSIEVWQGEHLVGGLYGIAVNGFFSGESMFYRQSNASKVALVHLAKLLSSLNINFIDCQLLNPFLADMGCIEIDRKTFIQGQQTAITKVVPENFWQKRSLS